VGEWKGQWQGDRTLTLTGDHRLVLVEVNGGRGHCFMGRGVQERGVGGGGGGGGVVGGGGRRFRQVLHSQKKRNVRARRGDIEQLKHQEEGKTGEFESIRYWGGNISSPSSRSVKGRKATYEGKRDGSNLDYGQENDSCFKRGSGRGRGTPRQILKNPYEDLGSKCELLLSNASEENAVRWG